MLHLKTLWTGRNKCYDKSNAIKTVNILLRFYNVLEKKFKGVVKDKGPYLMLFYEIYVQVKFGSGNKKTAFFCL